MFTLGRGFNAIGSIDSNRTRLSWNNGELPPTGLAHPQRETVLGPKSISSRKKKAVPCALLYPTVGVVATFRGLAIKYDVTAAELRAANELGPFADDADLATMSVVRIPINAENPAAVATLRVDDGAAKTDPELADDDDGGQPSFRSEIPAAAAAPKSKFDFFNKVDARMATFRKTSCATTAADADADEDLYRRRHVRAQVADEDAQSMHSMHSVYSINSEMVDVNVIDT